MSMKQKSAYICKIMKYRQVIDNHGHQFAISKTSSSTFYVLLRGEAVINCPSLAPHVCRSGDCFGYLYLPQNVEEAALSAGKDMKMTLSQHLFSTFNRYKKQKGSKKKKKIQVHIKKGSEYVMINSSDCATFFQKMSDRLSISTLLNSVGLKCLEKSYKVVTFPPNTTMVQEGTVPKFVYAIMEGECRLVKGSESDQNIFQGNLKKASNQDEDKQNVGGFGDGIGMPLAVNMRGEVVEEGKNGESNMYTQKRKKPICRLVLQSGFVAKLDTRNLAVLGPRSLMGDIPCFLKGTQPASCVSVGRVKALQFSADDYVDKMSQYPDLKKVFENMCKIRAAWVEQRWLVSGGHMSMAEAVDLEGMIKSQVEVIKRVWLRCWRREQEALREFEEILKRDELREEEGRKVRKISFQSSIVTESDNEGTGSRSPHAGRKSSLKNKKKNKKKKKELLERSLVMTQGRGSIGKNTMDETERKLERLLGISESSGKRPNTVSVDVLRSTAIIEADDLDLGPPEITFEMLFQRRVKKNPHVKRHKLLSEFKRLLEGRELERKAIEYEEPLDPFERFDFIDTSAYDYSSTALNWVPAKEEGWEGKFGYHSLLSPYPTITRERKLHGKNMPLVEHSDGYQCPFRSLIVRKLKEKELEEKKDAEVDIKDRTEIDKALKAGFFPHFAMRNSLSATNQRPSTVAGSTIAGGSSILSSTTSLRRGGTSVGPSIWTLEETEASKDDGNAKHFIDVVRRSQP